jgi:hypothetical protein
MGAQILGMAEASGQASVLAGASSELPVSSAGVPAAAVSVMLSGASPFSPSAVLSASGSPTSAA